MTLGTLFVYLVQLLIVLNITIATVYCKLKRLKFWDNAYFGVSVIILTLLVLIYISVGLCYLAEDWNKVIF